MAENAANRTCEILDHLPDVVFEADPAGTLTYVSEAWSELTRTPTAEAAALWPRLIDAAQREETIRFLAGAGPVDRLRVRLTRPDGAERCVELNRRSMPDAGGKPASLIGTMRDVSDEVARTAEMVSGYEGFTALADTAMIGIYRTDATGYLTYVNPAWLAKFGLTMDEALGNGWQRAIAYPETFVTDPPWVGFTPDNPYRSRINAYRSVDGAILEMETIQKAEFDADGQLSGFSGVMIDVTEQQRAIAALADSERRYHSLVDFAPAGIIRTDGNGAIVFANAAVLQMLDLTTEAAFGSGWAAAVHPADLPDLLEKLQAVLRTRTRTEVQFRFRHRAGTIRHVSAQIKAEHDAAGAFTGFICVLLDVTDHAAARAALQDRESKLAILAAHSMDAILRFDLAGICLYASPAVKQILGVPTRAIEGASLIKHFHPDDEAAVLADFRALASGAVDQAVIEYRARKPTSANATRYFWLEASSRLIRDPSGKPVEIVASVRNVSRRKDLEERLRFATQAAEAAARSKSIFLANMSHEIRTPMNGVIGSADLLLSDELTSDQRAHVERIERSGRTMLAMLDDVLDMARIEGGAVSVMPAPINLSEFLNHCLEEIRPALLGKPVTIDLLIDTSVPDRIVSDPLRLRQIIGNLLNNAAKFTERGAIQLSAATTSDGMLEFAVKDTGIGIPADRHAEIFDRFGQADPSIHSRFGGSGLGLAIASNLAVMLGGHLSVTSEQGTGARFALQIPCCAAPGGAAPGKVVNNQASGGDGVSHMILVAEDNPVNQAIVTAMLTRLGHSYRLACTGRETIELVAGAPPHTFDVVLMDLQMPEMDGLAAARVLRELGHTAEALPIVALTAHCDLAVEATAREAGMQGVLTKPLHLARLASALKSYAARRADA